MTMLLANVSISKNVTQVPTHVTRMHLALIPKAVSNVHVILVGLVMVTHAVISMNASLMFLITVLTLLTVLTSTAVSAANASQDSLQIPLPHPLLVMTLMNALMVLTRVTLKTAFVPTMMAASNVPVKTAGLILEESPTLFALILTNVYTMLSTTVTPTLNVPIMMVLSHVLVLMVSPVMEPRVTVLRTLWNLLMNVRLEHTIATLLPQLARIPMPDFCAIVKIVIFPLMHPMHAFLTLPHAIVKLT